MPPFPHSLNCSSQALFPAAESMARTKPLDLMSCYMEALDDGICLPPRRHCSDSGSGGQGESMADLEKREGGNRKRKRKRRKTEIGCDISHVETFEEGFARQDPLEGLGWDIMMKILGNLDARSVALSLLVSRGWHSCASSDRLWSSKCKELWLGKAHIPRLSQVRGISKLAAYSLSIMDGKRTRIVRDDLCDHAWEFHYTKVAPAYWKNLDPYWKGTKPLMHRYFHQDGSLTADPGDKVWGGHECCFTVVTSFLADGTIREHYVRVNRWPQLSVSRKKDGSWEMSNHLFCYNSIPDAYKEGGTGPPLLWIV